MKDWAGKRFLVGTDEISLCSNGKHPMVCVKANYVTTREAGRLKFYTYFARLCPVCGREQHELELMPEGMVW